MARVFRFVNSLGSEIYTINDSEHQLPVPQLEQLISIDDSKMRVEAVTLHRTDSRAVTVYDVRVRLIPKANGHPLIN